MASSPRSSVSATRSTSSSTSARGWPRSSARFSSSSPGTRSTAARVDGRGRGPGRASRASGVLTLLAVHRIRVEQQDGDAAVRARRRRRARRVRGTRPRCGVRGGRGRRRAVVVDLSAGLVPGLDRARRRRARRARDRRARRPRQGRPAANDRHGASSRSRRSTASFRSRESRADALARSRRRATEPDGLARGRRREVLRHADDRPAAVRARRSTSSSSTPRG